MVSRVRSFPWTALLLMSLVLASLSARAQEAPSARTVRTRTLYWEPGGAPPEVHVAAGTSTLVRLEAPAEAAVLGLPQARERVRLLRPDPSMLLLMPSDDFAVGERALLTVTVEGVPLQLALVSQRETVDGEVRLVQLRVPRLDEEGVDSLVQHLNSAPQARVSLTGPGPSVESTKIRLQVESVLRLGPRVLVTLSTLDAGKHAASWTREQFRLRAHLEDGSEVDLPLLLISGRSIRFRQRHTLLALLPGPTRHLSLAVEAAGVPTGFHTLHLREEAP